jgi:hypothetical protein
MIENLVIPLPRNQDKSVPATETGKDFHCTGFTSVLKVQKLS